MFKIFKKILCEIPDSKGGLKRVMVSRKQFNQWRAQGLHAVELNSFMAYIFDPKRNTYSEKWIEGHELSRGEYKKYKDKNGDVFCMLSYKGSKRSYKFMNKKTWDKLPKMTPAERNTIFEEL